MRCRTLNSLKHNLVVTTVDVGNARTAIFWHKTDTTIQWQADSATGAVGSGFATPLRRRANGGQLLKRVQPEEQMDYKQVRQRPVGELNVGRLQLELEDKEVDKEQVDWIAPIAFSEMDFKLVDVARATSAAPTFLPRESAPRRWVS